MAARATEIANRFEQINEDLIAAVETCSDADWQRRCEGEEWPVGVTAHHVAQSYPNFTGFIKNITSGTDLPTVTQEDLNNYNAKHATEAASSTRAETLKLLNRDGKVAADTIRSLTDEQLERTAPFSLAGGNDVSAAQVTEFLIGHPTDHLASIKTTLGR